MSRTVHVVQDAVDRHLRPHGFNPETYTVVHGANVLEAMTEVYVRGLADGAAQAGFAKVTALDGCWICGSVPTVAACIFGGVCESCYGDGQPLQMGPPTIPPRGLPMVRFAGGDGAKASSGAGDTDRSMGAGSDRSTTDPARPDVDRAGSPPTIEEMKRRDGSCPSCGRPCAIWGGLCSICGAVREPGPNA